MNKEKIVRLYDIKGKTNSGKEVSLLKNSSYGQAFKDFIEKYPGFKGTACFLVTEYIESSEGVFHSTNRSKILTWFDSSKQLKGWI